MSEIRTDTGKIKDIGGMKIRTEFIYPPIPIRKFDWSATDDDTYDEGQPIGYGETEREAIADLLTNLEESFEEGDARLYAIERARSALLLASEGGKNE